MNVYDFDGTIYDGDSSIDFFVYCLDKSWKYLPSIVLGTILFKLKIITTKEYKKKFFVFLKDIDVDKRTVSFWDKNQNKIKAFYFNNKKDSDLIISASPDFLINEIGKRLNVRVIATKMDKKTGKIIGENCKGTEKVKRLLEFTKEKVDEFYSDSYSDTPLAKTAKKAFIVKKHHIKNWKERKKI